MQTEINSSIVSPPNRRKPWQAALLSVFFPGAGQIYNGQFPKGIILGVTLLLLSYHKFTPITLWGFSWLFLVFFVQVLLFGFIFVDAVKTAKANKPFERKNWWLYLGLFSVYILFQVPRAFLSEIPKTFAIPSASMAPALLDGDMVVTDLRAFERISPKLGDLVIFRYPLDEKINYVSRVVAGPGDTVKFKSKVLFINGKEVKAELILAAELKEGITSLDDRKVLEPYLETLAGEGHPVFYNPSTLWNSDFGPITVPENKFFVLGDNRDRSSDSRIWGFVPAENFISKPVYVYFSMNPETKSIRWNRIGLRVK